MPKNLAPQSDNSEAKILVVDDDPDFLDLLENQIKKISGVGVSVAHGPAEALDLLTTQSYDLVVSDWALDAQTAPEVFVQADGMMTKIFARSEVLADANKIPVMFISGSEKVGPTQRLHTLRHFQPVSFLLKSCGPALISRLVEQILERFYPVGGTQISGSQAGGLQTCHIS